MAAVILMPFLRSAMAAASGSVTSDCFHNLIATTLILAAAGYSLLYLLIGGGLGGALLIFVIAKMLGSLIVDLSSLELEMGGFLDGQIATMKMSMAPPRPPPKSRYSKE
jgi:hypothetical protein